MGDERYVQVKERAEAYAAWYEKERVTAHIAENCREEAEQILAQADRLMAHTFSFEDRWDMEPCREPFTLKEMIWDISPNGDPEWIFMLNRHEYMNKLLIAGWLTGDTAYAEKLKWFLLHWIQANPILPEGTVTTRTIDTGIRCMSWQYLLLHLLGEGLIEEKEAGEILESMKDQFASLRKRYIGKYTLSNWGVLQTASICSGSLWFREYLPSDGTEDWAWKELERQIGLQVLDDGAHWEQSMMYHVEVLLACMKLLASCRAIGRIGSRNDKAGAGYGWGEPGGDGYSRDESDRDEPGGDGYVWNGDSRKEFWRSTDWLEKAVDRMSRYVLFATGPDHVQIAQCDSDVTDVRDVMVKAAVLTGDGRYKYAGYDTVDLDSAWLLGSAGIAGYRAMEGRMPESRSLEAADAGHIFFRSSWEEDSHFTYLKCGPLGSGHGHADLTHISLYYRGRSVLADSGRSSYVEEEPLRPFLKSAQAHNVCVIDGESHGRPRGSWGYDSFGQSFKNYYREQGPVHYGEMAYHGCLMSGEHYLVIRKVMAVDQGIWMIVNDIRCDGSHEVKEYYHLDSAVQAARTGPGTDRTGEYWRLCCGGDVSMTVLGSRPFESEPCILSKQYNQKEKSTCLVRKTGFTDRITDWACLLGEGTEAKKIPVFQYGSSRPEPEEQVTAMSFCISPDESWDFLVWNQETWQGGKIHYCKGVPVYAKAAAIHTINGNTTLYRLRI